MEMFKNNRFNTAALALYMCYFLHGIQAIIISVNSEYFAQMWNMSVAGVIGVIAYVGVGKLLGMLFTGLLADKIGRKPVVLMGVIGYIVLYAGLLFAHDYWLVSLLAGLGGFATSFFDGAVNPAIMEIYPNHRSTATTFNKGIIAIASTVYPLFVGTFAVTSKNYNIVLIVPLVLSIVVFGIIASITLPDGEIKKQENVSAAKAVQILEERQATSSEAVKKMNEPSLAVELVLLALFAFLIYSTFYLFQQVGSIYASDIIGLDSVAAKGVISIYTVGSFLAVLVNAVLMDRGLRDMAILVIYPLLSGIFALLIYLFPSAFLLNVGAFVIGFTAAGGVLQMGNGLLSKFFDTNKGRNTSLYYIIMTFGGILMPIFAKHLKDIEAFEFVMLMDAIVAFAAFALMFYLSRRYEYVFGVSAFSNSRKEK